MPSPRDNAPSAVAWLTAAASLLLPVAGVASALYGLFLIDRGSATAWIWLGGGILLILADMLFDGLWSRASASRSDKPDSNRRGAALVGQIVTVVEAIEHGGRGTVRVGDTVWLAEGVAAAAGTRVRIAGVKGPVLVVKRV